MGEQQAVFDFTRVGREWQLAFSLSAEQATRASLQLERPLRKQKKGESDEDYADSVQAFYDAKESMLQELRRLGDVQANLLAEVLVDVPREWLLPGAPEAIDWHQVDSLNYIQLQHYSWIVERVRSGEAMKLAKN